MLFVHLLLHSPVLARTNVPIREFSAFVVLSCQLMYAHKGLW
jgi:hypothetical protein